MMMNHSCEETLSKLRKIIVSLQNEIDHKNHKLLEMEDKHSETLACLRRLIIGLTENINPKERCLLEMECKYNESLNMVQKLMNDRDKLHEGCCNGILYSEIGRTINIEMCCWKGVLLSVCDGSFLLENLLEFKIFFNLQALLFANSTWTLLDFGLKLLSAIK